jgi:hypothetical protein
MLEKRYEKMESFRSFGVSLDRDLKFRNTFLDDAIFRDARSNEYIEPILKCSPVPLICEDAKSDNYRQTFYYRIMRLRTERRGNQCSEERAEPEGVVNGPVATSDTIEHFEITSIVR